MQVRDAAIINLQDRGTWWGDEPFFEASWGGEEIFDATLGGAKRFLSEYHIHHVQMSRKCKCWEMVYVTKRLTPARGETIFWSKLSGRTIFFRQVEAGKTFFNLASTGQLNILNFQNSVLPSRKWKEVPLHNLDIVNIYIMSSVWHFPLSPLSLLFLCEVAQNFGNSR